MRYPNSLLTQERKKFSDKAIKSNHLMYVRHKPGHDWDDSRELPDFSKIKLDQSMNWCAWSIPIWARFNDKKEYLKNYAIVAYLVDNIRNTQKYNETGIEFHPDVWTVIHKPIETNYSHSELKSNRKLSKKERREIRLTLKHTARTILKPDETCSELKLFLEKLNMIYYRITLLFLLR